MIIYQVTVEIAAPPLSLIKTLSFDNEERRDDFAYVADKSGFMKVTNKSVISVSATVGSAMAECQKESSLI